MAPALLPLVTMMAVSRFDADSMAALARCEEHGRERRRLMAVAGAYRESEDWESLAHALERLEVLHEDVSERVATLMTLAQVQLEHLDDHHAAIMTLERAVSLDPCEVDAWDLLAGLALRPRNDVDLEATFLTDSYESGIPSSMPPLSLERRITSAPPEVNEQSTRITLLVPPHAI
jgi:hypothetical protein